MTKKEADPTHALFVDELVRMYEQVHSKKYLFNGGKDGMALKRLLTIATREEILQTWAKGLTTDKEFDRVHNLAELAGKWTRLVAKPAQNPAVYRDADKYSVDRDDPKQAPFGACEVCGKGAWLQLHVPPNQPAHSLVAAFCASEDDAHLRAQMRGEFWPE